jgi:hypothetical protein
LPLLLDAYFDHFSFSGWQAGKLAGRQAGRQAKQVKRGQT